MKFAISTKNEGLAFGEVRSSSSPKSLFATKAPVLREKEILEESTEFVSFLDLLAMVPGLEMPQAQRLAKNASRFAEGASSLNVEENIEESMAQASAAPPGGADGENAEKSPTLQEDEAFQTPANYPGELPSGLATVAFPAGVWLEARETQTPKKDLTLS